ncbi:D-aminoacyl-tRNA deacylase [Ornithinicoccus halotolerans]|uniref:D-aminoacyl-tRNA deacylase n=1 Tax=Ornithinicoccus halotolerans TaxID=1748220 RepID=UPI001294B922|nr:D-aminoacyl-tRNA deacylase [Ornithinicoccus halotolerans]
MRAVLQRVSRAAVRVSGETVGALDAPGLVALVGVTHGDTEEQAGTLARRIARLRLLEGERSVTEAGAGVLVVSQFTLYGRTRKGRRPSWSDAAPAEVAEPLVETLTGLLRAEGVEVATGRFGARMEVELVADGPVTVLLDTAD